MKMLSKFEVARLTSYLILLTLLGRGLGFLKEVLVASLFGLGAQLDAFVIAFTMPTLLSGVLLSALQATVIPFYMEREQLSGRHTADSLFGSAMVASVVGGIALAVLVATMANPIVDFFAHGFEPMRATVAAQLLKMLAAMIPINLLLGLMTAYANMHRSYVAPAMAALPATLFTMVFLWWAAPAWGIEAYAWGLLGGSLVQIVVQAAGVFITCRPCWGLSFDMKALYALCVLTAPLLLGTAFSHLTEFIDQRMVSHLPAGANSALSLAMRLSGILTQSVVMSLSTIVFPPLAQAAAEGDEATLADHYYHGVRLAGLLLAPMTGLLVLLQGDIVALLFKRGAFDAQSVMLTAPVLAALGAGLLPMALSILTVRVFNSLKWSKRVAFVAACNVVLNISFNLALLPSLKHVGVALSTSLTYLLSGCLMHAWLTRRIATFSWKDYWRATGVSLLSATLAGGLAYETLPLLHHLDLPLWAYVSLVGSMFVGLYGTGLIMLKEPTMMSLSARFAPKLNLPAKP